MKRLLLILLSLFCLAGVLSACGSEKAVTEVDFTALSGELLDSGIYNDLMSPLDKDIAAMLYSVDAGCISECVLYCGTGATGEEIALFKAADSESAAAIAAAAQQRKSDQIESFKNYVPSEVPKIEKAVIKTNGQFVAYIVSCDADKAAEILKKYM